MADMEMSENIKRLSLLLVLHCVYNLNGVLTEDPSMWPRSEFRGVWVATVGNIDWPSSRHLSTAQQQHEITTMLDKLQSLNFNAVVLQIRTSCDALYNSTFEPWSYYLTGEQGKAPSPFYDPLQFIVKEAHSRNLELHAWFNPYRARAGSTSKIGLAKTHIANVYPEYAYAYGSDLWMDPGATVIQDHIVKVFKDVVKRYDVDGVHMDDYFYPYPVTGHDFPDSKTYQTYRENGGKLSLADWRRKNVDDLIKRLYTETKATKPWVKFGISPFGIWKPGFPHGVKGLSSYDAIFADSRKWLMNGWVDYLTPQLYWTIESPHQSYPDLLQWWLQQNNKHRHIYIGNYAAGIVAKHWDVTELENQVRISRRNYEHLSLGNIFFSAKYFSNNDHGIGDMFHKTIYNEPAIVPYMPWLCNVTVVPPYNVSVQGLRLSWKPRSTSGVRSWAIYKEYADTWMLVKILSAAETQFDSPSFGQYCIRAIGQCNALSVEVLVYVQDINIIGRSL